MEWKGTTAGPRSAHADSAERTHRQDGGAPKRVGLRLGDIWTDLSVPTQLPPHIARPEPRSRLSAARGDRREITVGLLAALRRKDAYTERHSVLVATYARCLAERLGVAPAMREDIWAAAALHDIGKIGIPDAILLKPAKLTHGEFEVMKLHPSMGEAILDSVESIRTIASLVLHHHEWHDGTGYPDGLRGADIPFGSKVIQAADCIDAMMSPRCYKRGMGFSKVIDELRSGAGIQFDPMVAEAAAAWLEAEPQCVVSSHFDTSLQAAVQA